MFVEMVLINNGKTAALLNENVPLVRFGDVVIGGRRLRPIAVTGFGDALDFEGEIDGLKGQPVKFLQPDDGVIKIYNRFDATGIGRVYTIDLNPDGVLKVGDMLYDMRENRFRVTSVHIGKVSGAQDGGVIGIAVEKLDGVDADGDFLYTRSIDELDLNMQQIKEVRSG